MKLDKTIKIGRHSSNDYILEASNDKTSRNHAILYIYSDGTYELEDTSTNGTFVNGTKINDSKIKVTRDDLIKFADQERFDWSKVDISSPVPYTIIFLLIGLIAALSVGGIAIKKLFIDKPDPCMSAPCDVKCIQKKYDKSVGLICHTYFLKVNFGEKKLFIGYDKRQYEKNRTLKEAFSIDQNKLLPFFITGTGFLIKNESPTDRANLATNRHVADPSWLINKRDYDSKNEKIFYEQIRIITDDAEKALGLPRNTNRQFITHSDIIKFIPSGSLFPLNEDITYQQILTKLGTGNSQVLRWSSEGNVDISVLATDIKDPDLYFIDLKNDINTNMACISLGDETTLLGYSGGITSGYSYEKGDIDYQISKGNISKAPSNFEITYDIPTTGGSSGSPIFDENGKLIAIHFANQELKGLGIPINFLLDVINLTNVVNKSDTNKLEYGK